LECDWDRPGESTRKAMGREGTKQHKTTPEGSRTAGENRGKKSRSLFWGFQFSLAKVEKALNSRLPGGRGVERPISLGREKEIGGGGKELQKRKM